MTARQTKPYATEQMRLHLIINRFICFEYSPARPILGLSITELVGTTGWTVPPMDI